VQKQSRRVTKNQKTSNSVKISSKNPYNVRERIKVNVVIILILITIESLSFLQLSSITALHLHHHKINPRTPIATSSHWNLP